MMTTNSGSLGVRSTILLLAALTGLAVSSPAQTLKWKVEGSKANDVFGSSIAVIDDLDGDGRNDLCYIAGNGQKRVLSARLQTAEGELGPELRFDLKEPRGVTLANIDGSPGSEILTIDSRTGRARIFRLLRPEIKAGELASRLIQYGIGPRKTGRHRWAR